MQRQHKQSSCRIKYHIIEVLLVISLLVFIGSICTLHYLKSRKQANEEQTKFEHSRHDSDMIINPTRLLQNGLSEVSMDDIREHMYTLDSDQNFNVHNDVIDIE